MMIEFRRIVQKHSVESSLLRKLHLDSLEGSYCAILDSPPVAAAR